MSQARNPVTVLALLLVLGSALVPVLSADTPPLLDYHNHLARQYILARIETSEYLRNWYVVSWHASPYLAFDVIVQGLAGLISIDDAGRAFVGLVILFLALAPVALNLALIGRVTPIALLGLLFAHNETVSLGFVNYLFSIGFGLCLAALWIRLRHASAWVRLLIFPVLATLVFFSHLHGLILYVLIVSTFELGEYIREATQRGDLKAWRLDRTQSWNLISIIFQSAVPLSIFVVFGPSTESISRITHGGLERKISLLWGIFEYLIPPYLWTLDRAVQFVLPLGLLLLVLTRRLRIDPRMRWPLGAVLVLFFVMPMELFGAWGTDHRLLPALALLFVGSLRPTPANESAMTRPWIYVGVSLIVSMRVAGVANEWHKANETYSEYRRAFAVIPNGSTLYFAFGHAGGKRIGIPSIYHYPTLALSVRDVYVPYLFASSSGTFTLQYRSHVEPWQRLSQGPVLLQRSSPDWPALVETFDYFLLVNEEYFQTPRPNGFSPVFEGASVKVYRRGSPSTSR